jgi:hypothetical protein
MEAQILEMAVVAVVVLVAQVSHFYILNIHNLILTFKLNIN